MSINFKVFAAFTFFWVQFQVLSEKLIEGDCTKMMLQPSYAYDSKGNTVEKPNRMSKCVCPWTE